MPHMDFLKIIDEVPDKKIKGEITLDMVKESLEISLSDCGFDISITKSEVTSGGLFRKQTESCIIIENTQHKTDYFYYCVFVRKVANFTTLHARYGGESKLTIAKNKEDEKKDSILGMIGVYSVDQAKFDEEYFYYNEVDNALNGLVS